MTGSTTREPAEHGPGATRGPVLVASGVAKAYRTPAGPVPALRGIDLVVERGTFLAVMGPSGSGKTTLLNCLSGLDEIDSGSVEVDGRDLGLMSDRARSDHRARSMGFVFQAFNLIPVMSAAENVELPLLLSGTKARTARRRAEEALATVGLSGRLQHRPNQLSGGEQQRVAIARALVGDPAVVWADEPTGNLDSANAESVMELLGALGESGRTLVMVTHDPHVARSADRLVQMHDGAVVADASPGQILGPPTAW